MYGLVEWNELPTMATVFNDRPRATVFNNGDSI